MIPKECKRLAEVDFPIAVVSRHSAKEKSIRHGHPSTLHLWWARRPLGACRAVLLGLLLPDPCDPNCPEEFKNRARNILPWVQGTAGLTVLDLRNELLRFIGDFANWDNASKPMFLEAARGLVRAAHGDEIPLVVDPFAGGGSIPLEALRLGCETFASDLNPVACLILKTMLEDIPRRGEGLCDELRKVGAAIRMEAEKKLGEYYPSDADGAKPIAYIWARTIICDSCGAELPLIRAFWLSKKLKRRRALRYTVSKEKSSPPKITFEIFGPEKDSDVPAGTVNRAKATCLCCSVVMPPDRVKTQLMAQRGGANVMFSEDGQRIGGALLLAIATLREDSAGRSYRLACSNDYQLIWSAHKEVAKLRREKLIDNVPVVPDEPTPAGGGSGAGRAFSVQNYGMMQFADLFTCRQMLALLTLSKAISKVEHADIKNLLSLALDRVASRGSSLCLWRYQADQEKVEHIFGRQALPVVWDFAEAVVISSSTGSFSDAVEVVAGASEALSKLLHSSGQTQQQDARKFSLPSEVASIWFTDPPYYDAVPYSELSDFFYVWLKRTQPGNPLLSDKTDPTNPLTPKVNEIVQDETKSIDGRPKDRMAFEAMMADAFAEGYRVLHRDGVGSVVFAHKTTEGWEALLSGMIRGGWTITGSWPIATEMKNRLRARESAALATSVHLICRPRDQRAEVGDWGNVLRELPNRVGDWIERLQTEGIKGADLVFACIGPAMEIYSRYHRVEDAEGHEIPLGGDPSAIEPHKRGFLAYVWETVGRLALEEVLGTAEARARNGVAGALEEDARLTALFLWTLQTTEADSTDVEASNEFEEDDDEEMPQRKIGYTLIYDVARRFAQPLGIHLDKWQGRIIETNKGIVRLLPVEERARQLFGEADAAAISRRIEDDVKARVNYSFAFMQDVDAAPEIKARGRGRKGAKSAPTAIPDAPAPQPVTTLDRLHAAMLLQRGGQTNGLRALLKEETQRGPDFLRLANALSRLYPKDSEEKRLLDAMLLAVPRS